MQSKSYFIWKNINSLDKDIIITKKPTIPKFEKRMESITIPGRNGTLYYNDDVYESTTMTIECTLLDWNKLLEIKKWLDGEDKLILSTQKDYFYNAVVRNKIDFTTIADKIYTFPITFDVQPIAHSIAEKEITINKATNLQITKSTYVIKPYIKVNGSGPITLTINNKNVILKDIEGYIELDCELEEAVKGEINCNDKVECEDFPILIPGTNNISWIGNVSSIQFKYREAFL